MHAAAPTPPTGPAQAALPAVDTVKQPSCGDIYRTGEQLAVGNSPTYLHDAELQAFLAYAATVPVKVKDRARGVPDGAGAIRVPLANAPDLFALIDAEDYPLVCRYRWRLQSPGQYAVATCGNHLLRMHRLILMVTSAAVDVDHKSRETLDNRKDNLRACSHAENMWNMKRRADSATGVKGVLIKGNRFLATVTVRKQVFRKRFSDLASAAEWVTERRDSLHGEFARHE